MAESTYKVGQKVRVVIDTPTGQPEFATIRVIQDKVGKKIGVEFDLSLAGGHSLDGKLEPEKVDPNTAIKYGRGWWTLEENIEKV